MRYTAFTLIELLVVIAIIAILAAILFPVFAQAKTAAKKTAALSQLKQVGTSMQIYIADYDDTYALGAVRGVGCYGSDGSYAYTYDAMNPFPVTAFNFSSSVADQCRLNAASSFATNAMIPYFKNLDMFKDAGTSFDRAPGSFSLTPSANKSSGPNDGRNLPKNLPRISYTYNGLLTGMGSTAVNSPATTPVYWQGMGRRNMYGHAYASPNLVCDFDAPCTYVATTAGCSVYVAGNNGKGSFHTTNTNKSGWDVFSRGVIYTYADSHAKFKKLNVGGTVPETAPASAATTSPLQDPFSAYLGNLASGRWYTKDPTAAGACHSYLFRPDWDGTTADPAYNAMGSSDQP